MAFNLIISVLSIILVALITFVSVYYGSGSLEPCEKKLFKKKHTKGIVPSWKRKVHN